MNRFVANLNIEQKAQANEKPRTLARLLAEEEAKLAALDKEKQAEKS
jgi:hypothetical protein